MKVKAAKFRVKEDEVVQLGKWPTLVEPIYRDKRQYKKILAEHVDELSALQKKFFAADRHALLLGFVDKSR
jgi:hypothetical protein